MPPNRRPWLGNGPRVGGGLWPRVDRNGCFRFGHRNRCCANWSFLSSGRAGRNEGIRRRRCAAFCLRNPLGDQRREQAGLVVELKGAPTTASEPMDRDKRQVTRSNRYPTVNAAAAFVSKSGGSTSSR